MLANLPVILTSMSPVISLVSISNTFNDPTRPCFKPSPDAITAVCPLHAEAVLTSILNGLPVKVLQNLNI